MTKRTFQSFKELLDHELPLEHIKLTHEGFKIDGNTNDSLKGYCKFSDLKSADYFCCREQKVYVIEFSDIIDQQLNILLKIDEIKCSNLPKAHKQDLCRHYLRELVQEMKEKFRDTDTIYHSLSGHFDDLDDEFNKAYHQCTLVFSDERLKDPEIPKLKKIELAKFLSTLASRITNSIPNHVNARVVIAPISEFCK
ncbi:hypothetical protein G5Y10_000779 [Vibrio parahaemolyticus]|nr:hypothetical protein [Vibrio parahaemolyticus]EIA1793811.1 hypothetical protein [Vibrio parahaemolyticus]